MGKREEEIAKAAARVMKEKAANASKAGNTAEAQRAQREAERLVKRAQRERDES